MIQENTTQSPLPNGWARTKVVEITDLVRGVTYPKEEASKEPKDLYIPILRANNINTELNFDNLLYVPIARVTQEQYIKAYDIVLAMSSGSKDLVGKTAQAKHDFNGSFGAFCGLLRASSELDRRYIGLFFQSQTYRNEISQLSSGVNINNLRRGDIENLFIPLSPLPEQHRIVAKMEELFTMLDAGVEALNKVKIQLKRYRQSVLKSAFEGKLTADWREAHKGELEPASVLLEEIKVERARSGKYKKLPPIDNSDLPELPEEWVWTRIADLTDSMKNGIYKPPQFYSDGGTACLRMYNIENGSIIWKNIKRMNLTLNEVREYELRVDDILVNRVNSRELVGKAAPIPPGLETCVYESKNIRLRLYTGYVKTKYVSCWLQMFSQQYFNRHAQQTVGMASINQEQLGSMPVPFPSLSEQQRIVEEIERHLSVADNIEKVLEQSLAKSERLRQSILKKAFEGRLVPQDPIDEPAKKLLERIKAEKTRQLANIMTPRGRNRRKPSQGRLI